MKQKTHWMIHSAVTIMAPSSGIVGLKADPKAVGGFSPVEHKMGEDQEIIQLAVDLRGPLKESTIREIFVEMAEKCIARARAANLTIA